MKVEIDKDYLGYTLRCSRRSSGPIPLGCATERRVYVNFPWWLSLEDLKELRDALDKQIKEDENH